MQFFFNLLSTLYIPKAFILMWFSKMEPHAYFVLLIFSSTNIHQTSFVEIIFLLNDWKHKPRESKTQWIFWIDSIYNFDTRLWACPLILTYGLSVVPAIEVHPLSDEFYGRLGSEHLEGRHVQVVNEEDEVFTQRWTKHSFSPVYKHFKFDMISANNLVFNTIVSLQSGVHKRIYSTFTF